ncbi:MAG: diguanylate cyclase, partial [Chloroflexi bacterium]
MTRRRSVASTPAPADAMHSRRKGEHLPRRRELTWLRSRLASWLALAGILLGLAMLRTVVNGYLSAILVSMPTLALVAAHRGDARERAELERRANHDPLTGLPNRTLFTERLDRALADRVDDELALLFLDLDDFKTVNDSLGHLVGDRLLGLVATRLRDCTGELGLAARHSGDEFAILLPGCGEVQAAELAQQVLDALARPVMLREGEVLVRGSIGIAISDATVRNGSEMLARADMAMYRAKADGKNRYELYEPAHRAAVLARHQLRVELQQAVDTGVLSVEYQPIVSLRDQAVIGAEALVRWRHPRRGTIDPEEFITVAEQSGLIVPLGLQVIEESCRRLAAWDR